MVPFQLRPYQQESLDHAITRNTIVCLATGFGKTLIAARLVDHYLKLSPEKVIAFLVPTRPLVEQQATYLVEQCRLPSGKPPIVQRIVGQDQADWGLMEWKECVQRSNVLLGTAALFQEMFVSKKFVGLDQVSLIVFDECHNAVGNSPMASVMRDAVIPHYLGSRSGSPRVLGLTASFVNGSLRNIEKKREALESLMQSTIFCPTVKPRLTDDRFHKVVWSETKALESSESRLKTCIQDTLDTFRHIKEAKKIISRCSHVFLELGRNALTYYVETVIVQQILDKARSLQEQDEANCSILANRMLQSIPQLKTSLAQLIRSFNADPLLSGTPLQSNKLASLLALVNQIISEPSGGAHRGIIFVEQVALVSSLAKEINDSCELLKCGAVAGSGYQNERDRQLQLDKFQEGSLQLLVSTAALEEGIDVSKCAYVIRYTSVSTTKAHIQGAGRARHPEGRIYYFDNDPIIERQKEAEMTATAKDSSLSLTTEQLKKNASTMNTTVDQRHPYPFGEALRGAGEVNVFNCKQIFNQYCSICLGASIRPKQSLYTYSNERGERKILSSIRYPTSQGWRTATSRDYKEFWFKVDLDQVFPSGRSKKKSSSDKEEMCFVYLVVVKLRECGLLDSHNQPSTQLRHVIRRSCPLNELPDNGISVNNVVFQSTR